jgi:hypothetical protein
MVVMAAAILISGVSSNFPSRMAASTESFQRYFRELKGAGNSMGPVERLVFSLVLAGAERHPAEQAKQ